MLVILCRGDKKLPEARGSHASLYFTLEYSFRLLSRIPMTLTLCFSSSILNCDLFSRRASLTRRAHRYRTQIRA
jgi:hypothetical protein